MRALLTLVTADFVARARPAPTPRRIAALAAWDGGGDVETRWAEALGQLCTGAREHWHVEAELVRAASPPTPRAVAHAFGQPGYLGGLGINSSPSI